MSNTTTINAFAATEAGGSLEPFTYEAGDLQPNEVEIDVHYCGICHSDLSMINNEWGMSKYPLVGGHEVIGKVAAVGANVDHLEIGTTVGLGWHSSYCGHCESCHSGDENLCSEAQGTIVARHGGFADKVRADVASVIPVPEGIDLKSAGPLLCGGITVFNPLVQFDVKSTDKVAVIGIGGLGHMALKFLSHWGCEVTAFTSSDSKREEALSMGAHKTLNSRDEAEIKAAANRFDFIISTVNVKLQWHRFVNTLRPKGRLHFVGAALEPLDIGAMSLISGQRSISGSPVGSPSTIETMFDFANRHQIQPEVEMFPMSQINEAIDRLKSGDARYRVVLSNV